MKAMRIALVALAISLLAACAGGSVKRVSEPTARIQQLTVAADGSWTIDLRLQNYSSIPMRFDRVDLTLEIAGQPAGSLQATPALDIGPESADVTRVRLVPSMAGKLAVADALADARGVTYRLQGRIDATPEDKGRRDFDIEASSALNPAPGLPGVLR